MTLQENQALQDFLNQLVQVRGLQKDPQADQMIARAVAQQPDAAYLLVQRAMLLEQAVNQATAQIAQLQGELQRNAQAATPSFLESANAWGHSAAGNMRPAASVPVSTPASNLAMASNPAMAPNLTSTAARPGFFGGNGGSFLSNMAATAAGVAGGAFLFHGIQSLLSNPSPAAGLAGSGLSSGLTSGLNDTPAEKAAADQFDAGQLAALDDDSDSSGSLADDAGDDSADDGFSDDDLTSI